MLVGRAGKRSDRSDRDLDRRAISQARLGGRTPGNLGLGRSPRRVRGPFGSREERCLRDRELPEVNAWPGTAGKQGLGENGENGDGGICLRQVSPRTY